jgi:hypothetical protein
VHDLDDTREEQYGVYYTKKKPLSLAAIRDAPGIWDLPAATGRSHGMEPNFVPRQS